MKMLKSEKEKMDVKTGKRGGGLMRFYIVRSVGMAWIRENIVNES